MKTIPVFDSMDPVREWQLCHKYRATDPEILKDAKRKPLHIPVVYERRRKP